MPCLCSHGAHYGQCSGSQCDCTLYEPFPLGGVEYTHVDDGSRWVRPLYTPPTWTKKSYGWLDVAYDDDGNPHQRYRFVGEKLP